jgi:hypothetical protein
VDDEAKRKLLARLARGSAIHTTRDALKAAYLVESGYHPRRGRPTEAGIVAAYVEGRIDVFEFEDRLDRLLGLG